MGKWKKSMGGFPIKDATKRFTGCKYISMGAHCCWMMPFFISTISSVMLMASSWSWVTKIVVTPVSSWMRRISSRISSLRRASRLERGSSKRRMSGSLIKARAMATLCCWPPESCPGFLDKSSSTCTSFAICCVFCWMSSLFSLRFTRGKAIFCATVMWG